MKETALLRVYISDVESLKRLHKTQETQLKAAVHSRYRTYQNINGEANGEEGLRKPQ